MTRAPQIHGLDCSLLSRVCSRKTLVFRERSRFAERGWGRSVGSVAFFYISSVEYQLWMLPVLFTTRSQDDTKLLKYLVADEVVTMKCQYRKFETSESGIAAERSLS